MTTPGGDLSARREALERLAGRIAARLERWLEAPGPAAYLDEATLAYAKQWRELRRLEERELEAGRRRGAELELPQSADAEREAKRVRRELGNQLMGRRA